MRRLDSIEQFFVSKHGALVGKAGPERWYLLEGMTSHIWQVWCGFCRKVLLDSCLGTTTQNGTVTAANVDWTSVERVTYLATCFSSGQKSPKPGKVTAHLRHELTWGDVRALLDAIAGLVPTNHADLNSGFGLSVNGAKHLQLLRNSCAHLNIETQNELKKIVTFYVGPGMKHPTDMLLWTEPNSGDPVLMAWLDDLRNIAARAIL